MNKPKGVKPKLQALKNKHLWIFALLFWLGLGVLNLHLLYSNEIEPSYTPVYSLEDLLALNLGFIFLPLGSVLLGWIVERNFRNSLDLGRFKYIGLVFSACLLLYSIEPLWYTFKSRIQYNYCTPIDMPNTVTYETDEAIITFKNTALSERLQQRLSSYHKDTSLYWNYKNEINLQKLVESNKNKPLYLKDSLEYLPDTFRIRLSYTRNRPNDSMPILDKNSLLNDYTLAMDFLIIGLLEEEEIMVFNKKEKSLEPYIAYHYWSMYPVGIGTSGKKYYFSNDSLFYSLILTLGL